jgi:dTDP-glucose 4,6-dehydratase
VAGAGARNGRAQVSVETLLGRPVLDVGEASLAGYLDGATVLVTGAGGSVGATLCTRLARLGVRELVLVDQAEAPLLELAATLQATPVLADIRSAARMTEVVERHRPQVVFHAAAYKQVPLLEGHPVEAVATNLLGTRNVVRAAGCAGVDRLVLFSTDKAVRPTSVLGQTKAVAEWVAAAAGYTSIRLGNVLDSAGSILPLFRRQAERGGPLTVTHPHATRYLITAGEAASLAIAAGALADPGLVYRLDTGPPVRVLDLARRLATEAGCEIEIVGLRAGERLHEQLDALSEETAIKHVVASPLPPVEPDWLDARVAALARHVERASAAGVRATLAELLAAPQREVAEAVAR